MFESTFSFSTIHLILLAPCIPENCIEIKIKLNFYFYTSLWCLKRFYEDPKVLHKTIWCTTKKWKYFYFNIIFLNAQDGKGLALQSLTLQRLKPTTMDVVFVSLLLTLEELRLDKVLGIVFIFFKMFLTGVLIFQ